MNQSPWPRRSVAPTHESERLYEYHGPVVSRKCFRWWIATSSPGRLLRRIVVSDEQDAREIVLLTNIFHPASSTVTAICKERWQIELFFKALKVKTLVGTSPPAEARPPARLQKPCGGQEASGVRAVRRAGENAVKRRFGPP